MFPAWAYGQRYAYSTVVSDCQCLLYLKLAFLTGLNSQIFQCEHPTSIVQTATAMNLLQKCCFNYIILIYLHHLCRTFTNKTNNIGQICNISHPKIL